MNGIWCDFVLMSINLQAEMFVLCSDAFLVLEKRHCKSIALPHLHRSHTHTHRVSAVCVWTTGLCCAVFRRRDCTSTKCSACSPPAPRSCVLMSTWTWRIAKTGTNMSKVNKKQTKQNRPYWFLCLETTLKTTLKCFIHHQHASHSILRVKCCSSSSVVPFCSH